MCRDRIQPPLNGAAGARGTEAWGPGGVGTRFLLDQMKAVLGEVVTTAQQYQRA